MKFVRVRRALEGLSRLPVAVLAHFRDRDPTFGAAFLPALVIAFALFSRSLYTNYIFDEQEALLANPYVNGPELGFFDVLSRDFWGLPSDRSIGSYRPLPNVLWRLLWRSHERLHHPWVHHALNIVIHAANAALVASFAARLRFGRRAAWLAGAAFVTSAVLTEAVSGVVGLADVLGGFGVLLALHSLALPLWAMPPCVFLALSVGFFSKESTLVALPIVAWCAFVTAPRLHARPRGVVRGLLAGVAAIGALVAYTEVRRAFFPVALPPELAQAASAELPLVKRAFHEFLRWFAQPRLPADPINNPLIDADLAHRVSGALRVYVRGLSQVVLPWTLSGDYSFAAEPIPERLFTVTSTLGGLLLVGPPVAALVLGLRGYVRARRRPEELDEEGAPTASTGWLVAAIVFLWVPVAYFPHSNIPMLLPTVRAERFWYLPVVGAALGLGVALGALTAPRRRQLGTLVVIAFLGFQAGRARAHALHYSNDLVFWQATARAVPDSAKAHLNYGVMLGARGKLAGRLAENKRALDLAPKWPMAHIYYGDTLCRLHRAEEAWPHYVRGFELAPNDRNLIALALQCLWDEEAVTEHERELRDLAEAQPGSWAAYLCRDLVNNGKKHNGVDPQYRPRGYDEGPKK